MKKKMQKKKQFTIIIEMLSVTCSTQKKNKWKIHKFVAGDPKTKKKNRFYLAISTKQKKKLKKRKMKLFK